MILEDKLEESNETIKLTDKDIFVKIWTSPRLVFKYLNDNSYDKFIAVLLIFAGITRAFSRASSQNMGDNISLPIVITICILIGGLMGWIGYYIYAAMMNWTGKWFNGQGDTKSLLRMMSYAMFPSIITLVLLIPQIAIFGNGIFQSEIDLYVNGFSSMIAFCIFIFVEIVLTIWSVVIFVIGISEIQKISIGKSILNMILPGIIIITPFVLIGFLIGILR